MRYFTTALQTEYKSKGIIVQCVYPGYVATAMTGLKPRWWSPDPLDYTRAASATIGILQHTYGYIPHAIQGYVLEVLWSLFPSRLIQNLMMSYMYKSSLKNKNN
jgi:17beta-estradiol 17-dehydrogenase / very-long-chain 3-oxoacyl-CoA reductase